MSFEVVSGLDARSGADETRGDALASPGRRQFLTGVAGVAGAAVASGVLAACSSSGNGHGHSAQAAADSTNTKPLAPPDHPKLVRVSSVYVPINSGLMDVLVKGFEAAHPSMSVTMIGGADALTTCKSGGSDMVICHYGHTEALDNNYSLQQFMDAGYGRWPRPVFFSQAVLVGVSSDPAKVSGLTDLVQAFKQIHDSGSTFIVDNTDYLPYLGACLLDAAGLQPGSWYLNLNSKSHQALVDAQRHNGYTLWGGVPFWTEAQSSQTSLVPYLWGDSSLQRMMVSVVANPAKVSGVNSEGATAFQTYLLEPEAQGAVREFRVQGFDQAPLFWPAGANNDPFFLPSYKPNESAVNPGAGSGAGSGG